MKKNKKILLSVAGVLTVALPSLAMISCGPTKTKEKGKDGIFFVTDGGDINDQSFNQSVYEGYKEALGYDSLAADKVPNVYKPKDQNAITSSYSAAKDNGAWLIVAPGFKHGSVIEEYAKNVDDMYYLFIDGVISEEKGGKKVQSLLFNMKQPSFVMGVIAAQKAVDMAAANTDDQTPNLGVYGGLNITPVTDYINGFKAGVQWYNDNNKDSKTVTVDDGGFAENFDTGGKSGTIATSLVSTKHAELVMAVGGPQYKDVLSAIKNTDKNTGADKRTDGKTLVIGVDTDLRKQSGDNLIWGSILKGLREATKNALTDILDNYIAKKKDVKDYFGHIHTGDLNNGEVGLVIGDAKKTQENNYGITEELLGHMKDGTTAKTIIDAAKALK